MQATFKATNELDAQGRPNGGTVVGTGLSITWQKGPLRADPTAPPSEPNGAFVETVLAAAIQRVEHYNEGQFRCRENSLAITHMEEALHWLNARTVRRTEAGVEGTHEGS